MDIGRAANRLNALVDLGVATVVAVAVGFTLSHIFWTLGFDSGVIESSSCAAALSFLLTFEVMRRIGRGTPGLALAQFVPPSFDFEVPDELLLTELHEPGELLLTDVHGPDELMLTEVHQPGDAIRQAGELLLSTVYRSAPTENEELLLDDILRELGPESRVVRLFDPSRMPTAGELHENIERHLNAAGKAAPQENAYQDDSQALHDALAELKRSLR